MSGLTSQEILDLARHTFEVEAEALNRMAASLDELESVVAKLL